jgi:hypothetical protein
MTPVAVKPDPPDVAGSHRDRARTRIAGISLDPDNQINDGSELRGGQRRNDGLASLRYLRRAQSAHGSPLGARAG